MKQENRREASVSIHISLFFNTIINTISIIAPGVIHMYIYFCFHFRFHIIQGSFTGG